MKMIRRTLTGLFQSTSADDISAIENDLNNPAVHLYDVTERNVRNCKDILPTTEIPQCEEICMELCQRLGIGFMTAQLLSLQIRDTKTNGTKWLGPKDAVKIEQGQELFLRFRHYPTKLGCAKLKELDGGGLQYLYCQISDDFLHELLQLEDGIAKSDGLGLVTISLLIKLRLDSEQNPGNSEDLTTFLKTTNVLKFVPRAFVNNNPIDNNTLQKSIKKHLRSLHNKYPASRHSSRDLMKCYLEHIFGKEALKTQFYEERFEGKKQMVSVGPSLEDVEVLVDKESSTLFIKPLNRQLESEMFKCVIKDLNSLEVRQSSLNDVSFHEVTIAHVKGIPKMLFFPSESEAKSFVSCLESFARLTCDYYSSLCQAEAPDWYQQMKRARVHGPSSKDYLKRVLSVKYNKDWYIIFKSILEYNEYYLMFIDENRKTQTKLVGKVKHTERGYQIQGKDMEPQRELREVLRSAIGKQSLVPARPQVEVCDTVYQLVQDGDVPRLAEEDKIEEEEQRKLEQQPKVYLPQDIEILKPEQPLGQGYFTDVHKASLLGEDLVTVKSLRLTEIPREYQHICFQSLQEAMVKQMKFSNSPLFVGFVGICLDNPTRLILKHNTDGNLKDFLRFRETTTPLHMQDLNQATLSLANALCFMEQKKLYHGNLNCSNILMSKPDSHTLIVKIADPGLVTLYNQMPLDSEVNRKRIPWLSPQLFNKLSDVTKHTEVYAFGTTIWEMFNSGWGPLDVGQQLNEFAHEKVLEFFQSGNHLECPVYLEECRDDPDEIQLMKKKMYKIIQQCWTLDKEKMLLPEKILKNIYQSLANYGNYHEYNMIVYSDIPFSNSQPLDVTSGTSGNVSLLYQRQAKKVPDLSCLFPSGQKVEQQQGQTASRSVGEESHEPTPAGTFVSEQVQIASNRREGLPFPTPAKQNAMGQTAPKATPQSPPVGLIGSPVTTGVNGLSLLGQNVMSGPKQGPSTQQQSTNPSTKRPVVKNVKYMIAEERLKIDSSKVLGQGHYGAVYKGLLTPLSSTGCSTPITVAVKRLKREMITRYAEDFRKEIAVMEELEHENIVKFYGVYRGEQNIVMEYLEGGSLYCYVVKTRLLNGSHQEKIIPQDKFISLSLDVAKGMAYLWSKKVLHMDLACRNVLLTKNLQAKVSDFGLSKVLANSDKDYYRRLPGSEKTIPILWCAVEWIAQERFTTKCDVWSFGCTVWEMCSYGKKPNICRDEQEFQKQGYPQLKAGKRLPSPEHCLPELYQLMKDSWAGNPEDRPEFTEIVERLKQLHSAVTSNISPQNTGSGACGASGDRKKHGSKTSDARSASESDDDYQKLTAKAGEGDISAGHQTSGGSLQMERTREVTAHSNPSGDRTSVANTEMISPRGETTPNQELTELKVSVPKTVVHSNLSGDAKPSNTTYGIEETSKYCRYIEEKDIEVSEECLGKGSFGRVLKGILKENDKDVEVAVKVFNSSEALHARFKTEMELLGTVSHPNVVQFIGLLKGNGRTEKYVMELMDMGSLSSYLRENGTTIPLSTRVGFLLDVAQGMAYLADKSILHCDLTAANVLLTSDLKAKIGDFGLSKSLAKEKDEIGDDNYKRKNAKFKLLWSAPEVFLKEVYTRTSDVWSYGVLCLEVFLNGQKIELGGKDSQYWQKKVQDYGRCIEEGERFHKPEGCPEEMYDLMKLCWNKFPQKRPSFNGILDKLR